MLSGFLRVLCVIFAFFAVKSFSVRIYKPANGTQNGTM